ncbi:MarR family winged helix-turn-helix transcriptional regulator [Paenibacillus wynnii]|uniref:MarR family winged helix-turn-helix transcriptional regulator n=1 Tax=Paenibacillus wynnii TaxID=268407 RepID=UPI00068DC77D|nr:MarR family transcriptional regulator [Paenibacillus wynnii]
MNSYEQLIIGIKQLYELSSEVTKPTAKEDIPDNYVFLLFMIYRKGKVKTTEISDYFSITPGAATAIADKLERMELIARNRDQKDRRIIHIELTENGLKYVEQRKKEHIALFQDILQDYNPEELETAIKTLNRLSESIVSYQQKGGSSK